MRPETVDVAHPPNSARHDKPFSFIDLRGDPDAWERVEMELADRETIPAAERTGSGTQARPH